MDATDTSLLVAHHSETEDADCACLCAQSAWPATNTDDVDDVAALQARRAAVEQRLKALTGRVAGSRES